ncbi:hypothetical protein E1292_28450 [Nonomuraea deserti]|uniref:Uncharacterized protein n=1 Tax=Nonomuraea deserti TaxID=1848322 RepID=A0A4V2Y9M5_9ACTN|nr:hypothetical protein [Nonomuraea deserti]TDD00496.1 hypothetical protein E1292_28450 [Nonomuraea deserti]
MAGITGFGVVEDLGDHRPGPATIEPHSHFRIAVACARRAPPGTGCRGRRSHRGMEPGVVVPLFLRRCK